MVGQFASFFSFCVQVICVILLLLEMEKNIEVHKFIAGKGQTSTVAWISPINDYDDIIIKTNMLLDMSFSPGII